MGLGGRSGGMSNQEDVGCYGVLNPCVSTNIRRATEEVFFPKPNGSL